MSLRALLQAVAVLAALVIAPTCGAATFSAKEVSAALERVKARRDVLAVSIPRLVRAGSGAGWRYEGAVAIWREEIRVIGAARVGVFAPNVSLPRGSVVRVRSDGHEDVIPESAIGPSFTVPLQRSDSLILEVVVPSERTSEVKFSITHVDVAPMSGVATKAAGGCQDFVNFECRRSSANTLAARAAVSVRLRFPDYVGVCSGALVNPIGGGSTNYMLSAAHCTEGVAPTEVIIDFGASAACGDSGWQSTSASTYASATVRGGDLVASFNDVALYRIPALPAAADGWRAGFDASNAPSGSEFFGVHHAGGRAKQWVRDSDGAVTLVLGLWQLRSTLAAGDGATSNGASGAPLFNAAQRIMGTLYGGDGESCTSVEDGVSQTGWNALSEAWLGGGTSATSLKPWLDPGNTGGRVSNGGEPTLGATAVNGACGSSNGGSFTAVPSANLCSAGTASVTDASGSDGSFNWSCSGSNGGSTASCSAVKTASVNGACGSANGASTSAFPTGGLCATGTMSATDSTGADGTYNWSCSGSNGGSNASCAAPKVTPVNGACGAANGGSGASYPATGHCATGTLIDTDRSGADGSFNWSCSGANGGTDASCSVLRVIAGACGPANGGSVTTYPASGLCAAGAAAGSDTSGSDGTFNWSCSGVNGGAAASCSAPKSGDGLCGTATGVASPTVPSSGLCQVGASSVTDSSGSDGSFNWQCAGVSGGATASCSAPKEVGQDGQCGAASGVAVTAMPSSGLCARGSSVLNDGAGDDGSFNWTCTGTNGGSANSCSAPKTLSGACGSAAGGTHASFPASGTCARGATTTVDAAGLDGSFNWTCGGVNGGAETACVATKALVVNGACGPAEGGSSTAFPEASACASGSLLKLDASGTDGSFNWQCGGAGGGTTATCASTKASAPVVVNGTCGNANSASTTAFPIEGLCATGTPTASDSVGADGNFNWSCLGSGGGQASACAAPRQGAGATPVNGACGPATQTSPEAMPATGLCSTGAVILSDADGSDGTFNWSCAGTNSGATATCSVVRLNPGPGMSNPDKEGGGSLDFGFLGLASLLLFLRRFRKAQQ